jgi:uncharacterized protein
MATSEARIPTPSAERYAKQLCNHAVHMGARSEWAPPDGMVEFPHGGTCRLTATPDELVLAVDAPTQHQLATIQSILAADFERFGQRHGMRVNWSP